MGGVASYVRTRFGRNNFGKFIKLQKQKKKKKKVEEELVVEEIEDTREPFTRIVTEFDYEFEIWSLGVQTGQTWISQWDSNMMSLMTQDGKMKQRARMQGCVQDISVHPKRGRLWMCSADDNSIREVRGIRTGKVIFTTENSPLCLCITKENNVIVGTKKEIVVFSIEGDIENRTESEKEIVIWPRRVVECPVTGRIAIADKDYSGWGGKDKPHVKVLSADLEVMWIYRGDKQFKGHNKREDPPKFDPYDLCFDYRGNLLIVNKTKRSVMLLDPDGYYVRNIIKDAHLPIAIGIQKDGLLWVGYGPISRIVRVIEYR